MNNKQPIKILLIDDDEDDYLITSDLLEEIANFPLLLDWEQTYEEGWQQLQKQLHDVYLVDYRLGIRTGLELVSEATKAGCKAPIILLTGQGDHEVDVEAMEAGAADYLIKGQLNASMLERSMRYAITQKQAEEALRESEARYRHICDLLADFSYTLAYESEQWFFEWLTNAGFVEVTGYTLDNLTSDNQWVFPQLVHEDDKMIYHSFWQKVQSGLRQVQEHRLKTKDGQIRWVRHYAYPEFENGQVARIFGAVEDVTELHLATEATKHLEVQLQQAQKMEAIGRLAGGIAHDFNNSLTIIMTCSELLQKWFHKNPEQAGYYIQEILQAGSKAASLTKQLLAFSRKQTLMPRLVDLNTLVLEMDTMLRRLISEDIELMTHPYAKHPLILADRSQLEQVVMNLVINARDAMPSGGRLVVTTGDVLLDEAYTEQLVGLQAGHYVTLTVSDTGVGMDKQTTAQIFEPFFTTKPEGKGTGLGLATVYGIIQQSNAHIEVNSELGYGTTFRAYFPVAEGQADTTELISEPKQLQGNETILVVEDEMTIRKVMSNALREQGYVVLEAEDGVEALQLSQHHHEEIDLIVTDVVMPHMNGPEFVQQLTQEALLKSKVLFVSGYADNIIAYQGLLEKGIHIFEKPFTANGLAQEVRKMLDYH